jgi:hypothetical protein
MIAWMRVKSDLASSWAFAAGNYLVVSAALIFDLSKRTFRTIAGADYPENAAATAWAAVAAECVPIAAGPTSRS